MISFSILNNSSSNLQLVEEQIHKHCLSSAHATIEIQSFNRRTRWLGNKTRPQPSTPRIDKMRLNKQIKKTFHLQIEMEINQNI